MDDNYNILRKHPDGMFIWIESAKDLQTIIDRLKQLAALSPAEYVAVHYETGRVVAKESSRAAKPRLLLRDGFNRAIPQVESLASGLS